MRFFSLINSEGTNCESSQHLDDPALVQDIITPDKTITDERSETSSDSNSSFLSSSSIAIIPEKCETISIQETTLEDCCVTYFSGYLAYKCMKKFNCIDCKINLT
jgi:hypothetical protein